MKKAYNEDSKERIVIIPPGGKPIIPGPGKFPGIPPWINPGGPGPVIPKPPNQPNIPNFPPIPQQEDKNKFVAKIKSVIEDQFVVVGTGKYLYAIGEKVNQYGIFRIIILENNVVIIRVEGGDFIRADDNDFLIADTNRKGATRFYMFKTADKEYVLQAPNGYYVRAREKDKRLIARAENPGPRTKFKFRTID